MGGAEGEGRFWLDRAEGGTTDGDGAQWGVEGEERGGGGGGGGAYWCYSATEFLQTKRAEQTDGRTGAPLERKGSFPT